MLVSTILYAPFTMERFPVPSTNDNAAVDISTLRVLQHSEMNVYEVKINPTHLNIQMLRKVVIKVVLIFREHFPLCSHSVLLQTLSSSPSGQSLSPSHVQCHDGSVMPFRQSWRLSGSIWYVLSIFSKSRSSNIFMYTSYLANYFLKYNRILLYYIDMI